MHLSITPEELGARLRCAREAEQITQADAAARIGAARTTLVAIEQGRRRIRLEEFQRLARLYQTSANTLRRADAVHVDLISAFRRRAPRDRHAHAAAKLLTVLVQAEAELESVLGIAHAHSAPPERPLPPGADARARAAEDAAELRRRLDLGIFPVRDPEAVLKLAFGMRVHTRRIDVRLCALFAYRERVGGCLLLNANHPPDRRAFACARALGHFASNRQRPDVLYRDGRDASRAGRYADAFARAFLMPPRAMERQFGRTVAGMSRLARLHVALLASEFGAPPEAAALQLEELALAPAGTRDWFAESGAAGGSAREIADGFPMENAIQTDADRIVPLRIGLMALEAWEKELLSEGQLAHLLNLKRIELRDLLIGMEAERGDADDALELAA